MNNKEYAGNIGLPAMAGTVVNSTFVHLINFSACGQVSASKPPLRQAKNRYASLAHNQLKGSNYDRIFGSGRSHPLSFHLILHLLHPQADTIRFGLCQPL